MTTDYAGNFVYEGGNLQFLNHPEGYIEPDGSGGYDYIYQCKDHLGNIRLSFADDNGDGSVATSEIREENNYYPFGLKHMGYKGVVNGRNHKYGYGGKEEQDELDLRWLDITARNYDPALGRWMNLDPLAEMMRRHSPYNYAFDNPIYFIDPDGMAPEGSNEGGQSNDSGTQFRVKDEHGTVVTMNSEQLAEYITANGVTEDFTFDDGTGGGNGDCCGRRRGSGDRARKRNEQKRQLKKDKLSITENIDESQPKEDPLKQHLNEAISLEKWISIYGDKTQKEIALERGKDKFGLPLGPKIENRNVINPYDGNVLDMRHVVVVGYGMGEVQGYGAEIIQKIAAIFGKDPTNSAFNLQDKYSNNVGAAFFTYDFRRHGIDMSNNFGIRFEAFLGEVYNNNKK